MLVAHPLAEHSSHTDPGDRHPTQVAAAQADINKMPYEANIKYWI
jgi:hypothetical protein